MITNKGFCTKKKVLTLILILSAIISATGCEGNYPETADKNETEGAAIVANATLPIRDLSFYMNDSECFETETYDAGLVTREIRRMYIEDISYVGTGGEESNPQAAITFKDRGVSVTKIFSMDNSRLNRMDFAKGSVVELRISWPKLALCNSATIIEFDDNGTNPHYRPYA